MGPERRRSFRTGRESASQIYGVKFSARESARRRVEVGAEEGGSLGRAGSLTVTVVSLWGTELIWMEPWWALTIHWAMLRPRPEPWISWVWARSPRKKRSKTRGSVSG